MTIFRSAPRRPIGHWKPYYFGNSKRGLAKTAARGITWHDFDHGLTRDGRWKIGHGNPEKVYFRGRRMRDYTAAQVARMRYRGFRIWGPGPMYAYAKRLKRNIEIEPKGNDPRYTQEIYWINLARICRNVWGPKWRQHYYVKVLDNHGKPFAVKVIKAAAAAGFHAGPTRDWDIPENLLTSR